MYDQIAHYYEITHAPLVEDIPWVVAWAAQAGGAVLELGCGSGRLLLPLAQAGHTVVGLDNSAAMLALAQAKLAQEPMAVQARVALHTADMTHFSLPQTDFALALIPYNTLLHIPPAQLGRTLRTIQAHLRPGGYLLMDSSNPAWLASAAEGEEWELEQEFEDTAAGEQVAQYAQYSVNQQEQIFHLGWRFVVQGTAARQTTVAADYYYYYPHQLQLALAEQGFHLRQWAGNYDNTPFDEESERLLVVAQK